MSVLLTQVEKHLGIDVRPAASELDSTEVQYRSTSRYYAPLPELLAKAIYFSMTRHGGQGR